MALQRVGTKAPISKEKACKISEKFTKIRDLYKKACLIDNAVGNLKEGSARSAR